MEQTIVQSKMLATDDSVQEHIIGKDLQLDEIAGLKEKYGHGCKVISDIGDFTHVINIQKEHQSLHVKFQLEKSYPHTAPCVIIKNACLDHSDISELRKQVSSKAQSCVGSKMMNELTEFAFSWCVGKEFTEIKNSKPEKSPLKQRNKKHKDKAIDQELKSEKKLPSMKTAEDVISRIMWDDSIPTEHFCVGYEDRFVGIVERQFIEFSWEDIASVDYDTLAIPKHRIQYFKYKELVVWDKNKRLDNVFGSTGSNIKITDVIEQYEKDKVAVSQITSPSRDTDSEDDEDIVIKVDGNDDVQYAKDKYWGPKKRPTHFLALRVTEPHIVNTMEEVHRKIIEFEPTYEESLVPTRKLHVTLACLGLDDDYEVDKASEFLKEYQPELESLKPKSMAVKFHGVDHFFHNVLYANIEENDEILNLVQNLQKSLQRAGIEIRDVFDFNPHMTILKFKKYHQAMAHTRYIDSKLYDMFAHTHFGEQSFNNIHLCKMSAEDEADDGFYVCPRKIHFLN